MDPTASTAATELPANISEWSPSVSWSRIRWATAFSSLYTRSQPTLRKLIPHTARSGAAEVLPQSGLKRNGHTLLTRGCAREPCFGRVGQKQWLDERARHLARVVHVSRGRGAQLDQVAVHAARSGQGGPHLLVIGPYAAVGRAQPGDQCRLQVRGQALVLGHKWALGVVKGLRSTDRRVVEGIEVDGHEHGG